MSAFLCVIALGSLAADTERMETCERISMISEANGVPAHVVLATAMVESRMNKAARSGAGAVGTLQILRKWHCLDDDDCDVEKVGVRLLRKLYLKYGSWDIAWCHYSAGNKCTKSGQKYSAKVRARVLRFWRWNLHLDEGLRPPRRLK
jgi:hypothetical protein